MARHLWTLFPWMVFGGIHGFLLDYERQHPIDYWWWLGVAAANLCLVSTIAIIVALHRLKMSLAALFAIQFVFVLQAIAISHLGACGLVGGYLLAVPLYYYCPVQNEVGRSTEQENQIAEEVEN